MRKFWDKPDQRKVTYYADIPFSAFRDDAEWNLWDVKSGLQEAVKITGERIPGVSDSYSYVGRKYSYSSGHVEDSVAFSVNYQHFGTQKEWIFITKAGVEAFERSE
jgi:hypothetical protein